MFPKILKLSRSFVSRTKRFNHQSAVLKNLYDDFDNYFPKIIESSLINEQYANEELRQHITKISTYHISARDPIQGHLTLLAFAELADQKHLTAEKLHQIKVLAWAVEMVQSYLIFADDMEDNCKTRGGKICWHLLPDVGLMAISDASLLRTFICEMLYNNFNEPTSYKMNKIFNDAFFNINIGQRMDAKLSRTKDFSEFTMEQYNICSNYKSSFYTGKFPILLALELCNKTNKDSYTYIDKVGTDLGILLQIQNDFMDYIDFDSGSIKTSSDIQMRKCSWVAVAALQNCNESQRKMFEACYGHWEPEKVERIRQLYKDIDLVPIYRQEEQRRYQSIKEQIDKFPADASPDADFFNKIINFYRRYTEDISPSKLYK